MGVVGTARLAKLIVGEFGLEKQSMTAYFVVNVDDESDGPVVVSKAPGLPSAGSLYAWGNDAGLSGILATRKDLKFRRGKPLKEWIVECPYEWSAAASSPPGSGPGGLRDEQGQIVSDPADAYARLVPGFVTYTEVADQATYLGVQHPAGDGNVSGWTIGKKMPVCNSAGVPVIPGKEKQRARLALRLTGWFIQWEDLFEDTILTVNSEDCLIKYTIGGLDKFKKVFPPRTLLCYSVTVQEVWVGSFLWYVVTAELHYNKDTWVHKELDQGYLVRVKSGEDDGLGGTFSIADFPAGVGTYFRRLLDVRGRPVNQKLLFDGDGKLLDDPKPENARYIKFLIEDEVSFAPLIGAYNL